MDLEHETQVRTENGETVIELPEDALAELGVEAGDYVRVSDRHGDMRIETPAGAITVSRSPD